MKKRKKTKWRWILGGLLCLSVLVPVMLWFGLTWFVRAAVKSPAQKSPSRDIPEKISKDERQRLEDIIKERRR